jgi:hypothetical protein
MRESEGTRWTLGDGCGDEERYDEFDELGVRAVAACAAGRVSEAKMEEGVVGDGTARKEGCCCWDLELAVEMGVG